MATHEIKADLDVDGEVQGTSLDINGNADISGNLTGLDNVTSTNFIIGGHTINDVDITSEDSNADDHLMTSKAIVNLIADNENSFLTSVPNHSGNLITSGTVAAARVATLNQNTTGSSGSCTGNAATATTATTATDATNLNATDDRDMAPEDYGYSNDFRIFFTSKEGLEDGSSTSGNWMDALYLNSYNDSSGHDANLLAFDKSTKAIYHYQADQAASNWGTAKQLAYTDSDITGNADTADTALEATNVTTTANNSANETVYPTFVDGPSGAQGIETDTGLHYNPSSGMLTAAGFTGALTGNASGSSGSCTGNAATATLAATSTIASDTGAATHFPVFVDGSTGSRALKAHSSWNYNPGTSTLTAGKLATDVASIVENNKSNSALMTLTGQGAGDESNISLKMLGTSAGNPIKLKMVGLDSGGGQVGAGFISYDAEDDSFGIGQSSSHNRMGVKIENTISLTSPNVHYEPTSIKAREFVATSNSTHYDFYGDIIRNGNDATTRGKLYVYKNGTWTITNADTKLDANGLLGLAIGTNSTTHGMLLRGTFTLDYDPGGNGNPLYISTTDGVMSTTVPSTSGHIVRLVGYLLGGTHGNMFFDPDKTYIEVA
tara:strand:+ start:2147 stop:3970 length:1824 start_codon:yes stop_codon:yes gene_type:complete